MTLVLTKSQCWRIKSRERERGNLFKTVRRVTPEDMQAHISVSNSLVAVFRLSQGHLESNDGKKSSNLSDLPEDSEWRRGILFYSRSPHLPVSLRSP